MDLTVIYSHLGMRRRRMLTYLLQHQELDGDEHTGDLIFHCGPDGRVTFEAISRRRGEADLLAEVS